MNTQLTFEEKLIFRNVKKAAIIWLLLLRMDPQPVSESTAAETLQIDKETARKYLRTLAESQIVSRLGRFEGYQLTRSGRQMALPFELEQLQPAAAQTEMTTPDQTNAEIPRSKPFNNNKIEEPLKTNNLLLLIKDERGNSALERGNSALEPDRADRNDYTKQPVDKIVDKIEPEEIEAIIDRIIEETPEKKAILDQLLFCHITMNWKTLALLFSDEITTQEIKEQYHFLEKKGMADQTGLLITNLLAKYKPRGAAFDPDTGHPIECHCYRCIGARNERIINGTDPGRIREYSEWNDQ